MANYYIATTGNDTTGNGSSGTPWATLSKACSVAVAGDTINVGAGTFLETAVSTLAAKVNIVGAGSASSIIKANAIFNTTAMIYGYSAVGTDATQSISGVTIDGNGLKGFVGIWLQGRSNVSIHDCIFKDWLITGVIFEGRNDNGNGAPSTYATGNSFYNNTVTNCSGFSRTFTVTAANATVGAIYTNNGKSFTVRATISGATSLSLVGTGAPAASGTLTKSSGTGDATITFSSSAIGTGFGGIRIGGQDGIQIYNNTMTQTDRSGSNGYCIKFFNDGYLKNVKIYGNTITKGAYDGVTFMFSIELWRCIEGCEIYNNTIVGSIDICYGSNSPTGYGIKIYGNTIGTDTKQSQAESGIQLEDGGSYIYIYNNLFKNLNKGIRVQQQNGSAFTFDKLYIYNNIFNQVGYTGGTSDGLNGTAISFISNINSGTWSNFYIYHNTIYTSYAEGFYGIAPHGIGVGTNWYIRNNIIQGFATAPIYSTMKTAASTIDVLVIENNNMYGNGNSNAYLTSGITPTNVTNSGNLTGDTKLNTTTWALGSGSAALNAGTIVTKSLVTTDYAGKARGIKPDIGAIETAADFAGSGGIGFRMGVGL